MPRMVCWKRNMPVLECTSNSAATATETAATSAGVVVSVAVVVGAVVAI